MKIKEFATVINGSTPSTKHPEYYDGDIIWVTPKDLSDQGSKYFYKGERNITLEGYNSCSTTMIKKESILMSSRAPIGLLSINKTDCCTNQGFKSLVLNENICDVEYLYYYLKFHIKEIEALGSGTTFKEVSKTSIEEYEVELPPLETQRKIANILSQIDDKIINNNKAIFELESMAKTLYDYWFLQFEFPNEEGKPYKSSGGKMVWNEELKRDIPEGWNSNIVSDVVKSISIGLNPRDNFVLNSDNADVKYITVKNLTTKGTLDFTGCDYITKEIKAMINKRSKVDKGDILFASIAPLGRCYLVCETPKDWEINESVFSIKPNNDIISSEYLYMFFMSDYFVKLAEHNSTGSIFSGIRVSVLNNTKLLVPDKKVIDAFSDVISDLMNKKYQLEKQSQQLTSLRDFLLPMLMNGQVTFKKEGESIA